MNSEETADLEVKSGLGQRGALIGIALGATGVLALALIFGLGGEDEESFETASGEPTTSEQQVEAQENELGLSTTLEDLNQQDQIKVSTTVTESPRQTATTTSKTSSEMTDHNHEDPKPTQTTAAPAAPKPVSGNYDDITSFGIFHGTSSHTHDDSLAGGRTAITTEALVSYNALRAFEGLGELDLETIGRWAFDKQLTNNDVPYDRDLEGAGLYIAMQAAKVGWMKDAGFDSQVVADIQRNARQGNTDAVMKMVEQSGRPGYADYLRSEGLVATFINTLKMEPHYGGWMHGRMHGGRPFYDAGGASVATAHDLHHLTVLSHDQMDPFMNDTFDWPQWPALEVPESDVLNYFQAMVTLGDPNGSGLA